MLGHAPIPQAAPSKTNVPPAEMAPNDRLFGPLRRAGGCPECVNTTARRVGKHFFLRVPTHAKCTVRFRETLTLV